MSDLVRQSSQADSWKVNPWGTWANRLTLGPTPDPNDDPQHVDPWSVAHVPDPRAAISTIDGTLAPHGGTPQTLPAIAPDHDAAGNIVYDGTYIYQYDGWSRLVQVNLAAQPPPGGGPAVGDSVPGTSQLAGPLVKHFTYDGLGRLVRVLSPYPEPGATPPAGWTTAPVRSERLYYDGVRRIHEVYTDPLLALGESAASGDPEAQGEVSQGGEEEGQTLEGEEGQIESGSGEPGGEDPPGPPPNTFITYLEREYLWGPGDGITAGAGAGLDELVAIFDIDRRAWWTLLDASGDVVAIVDDSESTTHGYGPGSGSGGGGATTPARLCAQFCYDAYGSLLTAQELHPFPDPRTGHKGLHLDRLDAGVADPLTGAQVPRHVDPASLAVPHSLAHSYFVRNRHYSPNLGRFLQRDLNDTASFVQSSGFVGLLPGEIAPVRVSGHLRDGVGVYGYLRGSPFGATDVFGLQSGYDPFDWVDDYQAESAAERAAFMQDVRKGFDVTVHLALAVLQLHPGVAAAMAINDVLSGNVTFGTVLDLLPIASKARALFTRSAVQTHHLIGRYELRRAPTSPLVARNRASGLAAEDVLRAATGGTRGSFKTSVGMRFVDNLVGTVAMESKVGRVSLSKRIQEQVRKDALLIKEFKGQVTAVEWHFFVSPTTGLGGPTKPLEAALRAAGIGIVIH